MAGIIVGVIKISR